MARLGIFGLAIACLGLFAGTPASADATRINDLVVLDGTVLHFDPFDGLNDTTRDPGWQLQYMKSLLTYETQPGLTERADVEKRVSTGAQCLSCMVNTLLVVGAPINTKLFAFGVCNAWCAFFTLNSMITRSSGYAGELGWNWQNAQPLSQQKTAWNDAP
ncbi:hypothetical protein BJ170DRAFT_277963 [Xylariales sp. AK1849]|nr:hypothetical protein BJ170DRAFT_277963 [Xylariales sp. AK1849]